ncbi:hypothetical protein PVAP13_4NG257911 [Panicum virgatum]|uniref:Uncharacterized protein n=1 Tax=Panicum virgatum TaxID=38727 RepID=A0A8T0TEE3_PANVG|nr:hypothetical protein PVAP13_4NG257911 [Panicum virgatum]
MARPHGMEAREFKEYLLPRGPASQGASEFANKNCSCIIISLPLPFSWCSSSSPMGTVATTHALFLLFLAEAPSSWPGVLGVLLRPW